MRLPGVEFAATGWEGWMDEETATPMLLILQATARI
jgi:hypothetical protein